MKKRNISYVVFLSLVAALGGFLFGYDTAVVSGTVDRVSLQYRLSTMQQGWFVGCALVGSIIGVLLAGGTSEWLGRKKSMQLASVFFIFSGIGCALAASYTQLVVYRIFGGIGIGIVSITSPMYISEVAITKYRGRLVSLYQLAITIGFLGAYLVNYGLLKVAMETSQPLSGFTMKIFRTEFWRGMLGMEAFPAVLFFIVLFFIPESPRWLVMHGLVARAIAILKKINDEAELEMQALLLCVGQKHIWQAVWKLALCRPYVKPLLVGVVIAMLGQFMGINAVLYYGPSIFRDSGLSDGDSLFYQVLVGMVNVLTTILALIIIDRVGRKKLVYYGVSGMVLCLVLIGFYFLRGNALGLSSIFLLTFFLLYIFFCAVSVCAVVFVLLSEMYPNVVRGVAMSIAGFSLWVGTYLIGQLTPWMLETLTSAGTFFLFAFMCLPYMWIVWKQVPETAGKTLEEIEGLWQ